MSGHAATALPSYETAAVTPARAGTRPRILMTTDAVGGVWRYSLDLTRHVKARGFEPVLVGFGPRPSADQRSEAEDIAPLHWHEAPLDWMAEAPGDLSRVPFLIAETAATTGADILHLNAPTQAAGLNTSRPVVVVTHSCLPTWFAETKRSGLPRDLEWHRSLNRAGFDRATAIVSPSNSHGMSVQRTYRQTRPIDVVHNVLSVIPRAAGRRRFVLAAARWWDEAKNAAVLDAAAAALDRPLTAVGSVDGPDGSKVALNHADHRGRLPHAEVLALMAQSAIFVSPSLYEPFGLAALEAAAAGAALVLADIPTYRELWSGAALFADPEDPQAFADAVNRLSGDFTMRERYARRARARSNRYRAAAQADAMARIYRRLLMPLTTDRPARQT